MLKNKCLLTCIVSAILLLPSSEIQAYTVTTVKNVQNQNYNYAGNNIYGNDLARMEQYLFGKVYSSEKNTARLNRIEKKLFNQTYSSMNISQRMNNALANYTGEDYSKMNNYYNYSNAGYRTPSIKNRLINTFSGQPTGYTPPIPPPYVNRIGPSYNRGFYGTNGWGYNNSYFPAITGGGIRILN